MAFSPEWRLNAVLGPFAGLRITADTPFNDELEAGELGLVAGAGVALPLGPGSATLDLRYEHGLTSVKRGASVENRTFLIVLGYALPLRRRRAGR